MFEKASRLKIRFVYKGLCSVEDLWDLSVEELDSIYRKMVKTVRETEEESLLTPAPKNNDVTLGIEIVKHIVQVKLKEAQDIKDAAEKTLKKQRLMRLIASKQDQELESKSLDELRAMVEEL